MSLPTLTLNGKQFKDNHGQLTPLELTFHIRNFLFLSLPVR